MDSHQPVATLTNARPISSSQILGLWLAVAAPMTVLAWVVAPWAIERVPAPASGTYWLVLSLGLAWQTIIALLVLRRETGALHWGALRQRLWLTAPTPTPGGHIAWRPWARLLIDGPALVALGLIASLAGVVALLVARFGFEIQSVPGLTWPAYANLSELASPEFAGQGWVLAVGLALWIWGAFLAEELFFRGVLLPASVGVFGRHAGLINAALYGLYYAFQYWLIPLRLLIGLLIADAAWRSKSNLPALALRGFEGLVVFLWLWIGVQSRPLTAESAAVPLPHIEPRPAPMNLYRGALTALPAFDPTSGAPYQVDLRAADLTNLDLQTTEASLVFADFDTRTTWPKSLPPGFDPARVLALGQDPGLGLRALHAQAITGLGVGVAIIDQALLVEHVEYADRLRWYEEASSSDLAPATAQMHGPAVASIAVGNTVGVAPGADLYFIGTGNTLTSIATMSHEYAQGIRRILQVNAQLPEDRRIRVISLSAGFVATPWIAGYDDFQRARLEAEAGGLMVVNVDGATGLPEGVMLLGLGRAPSEDPDSFAAYEPGHFFATDFYAGRLRATQLFAPMDSRTVAAANGAGDYAFGRVGGMSWVSPYFAGLYALAAQVDPAITPERFWALALSTGRSTTITHAGQAYDLGLIVDPAALLEAVYTGH